MDDLQMQMMFRRDITAPLLVQTQVNLLMQGDNEANALVIDLYDGDQPADASGYTVEGYLLRADGAKVPLKGGVNNNRVTVPLNEHCYLVPGPYGAFVRLVKEDFKRTILKIAGEIESEGDGPVVDIDEKFVTVEDVIEQMEAMIQVTEAARSATAAANAAASSANTTAQTANSAAARANTAAASVEEMTVSSEDVGPGTQASAQISSADGKKHIHFKLRQGATGATPDITFRVATGAPGTQVKVQQSGTPEAPVVDLTIPRGDTGAVDGIDYYEGSPAALGTASPGAANGLARGDHVHPMPTASDVGALPVSGMAVDSEKLGGKAPGYYIRSVNLLDNSYFLNPVNQRGADGSYGAWGGHIIDRWLAYADGATVNMTNQGLSLYKSIYQPIDADTMLRYNGKPLTYAVKIDGVVYVASGLFEQTGAWHMIQRIETPYGYVLFEVENNDYLFCIINNNISAATIEWAALYEGEYTADNLPPYVPKGYATELEECRRYYRIYKSVYIKPAILESKNKRHYRFEFDSPMQSAPDPVFLTLTEKSMWSEVNRAFNAYFSDEYGVTFASETMLSDSDDGTNVYCNGDIAFDSDL